MVRMKKPSKKKREELKKEQEEYEKKEEERIQKEFEELEKEDGYKERDRKMEVSLKELPDEKGWFEVFVNGNKVPLSLRWTVAKDKPNIALMCIDFGKEWDETGNYLSIEAEKRIIKSLEKAVNDEWRITIGSTMVEELVKILRGIEILPLSK